MGEASRRKRERREALRNELRLDRIAEQFKLTRHLAALYGPSDLGRFASHKPNIANSLHKALYLGRSMGKRALFGMLYGRQLGKSTETWWIADGFSFSPDPYKYRTPRYLYGVPDETMHVKFGDGEEWESRVSQMPPEDQLFLQEQPGYEHVCSECPMSLTCMRGAEHWPVVCKHCRTYSMRTVSTFDVSLHQQVNVREVELKDDYRSEDRKVSVMCPLFHNSTLWCHQCAATDRKDKPKLLRIYVVGGYRPNGRTPLGKPRVIKKKLAKKRLKKLYWEQLWKAPGVAHARRKKASSPSKLKAYRLMEKKQKEKLFDSVMSHSARTRKERKQKEPEKKEAMSSRNRRIDDLRRALRTGKDVRNKNHLTMIRDGTRAFDPAHPDCAACELNLVCMTGREINWFTANADKRACATGRCLVQFQFHATVCLTYDRIRRRITDHWQYGRSVSTSRAIRWYLEALLENNIIPYSFDENKLIKTFRDRPQGKGEGWISCP